MRRTILLAAALAVTIPGSVLAQRNRGRSHDHRESGDWLANCRHNGDWDDRSRAKFCEERTMGWSARAGASLNVDASPNGGVSVTGWDKDSVHVIVRVQAQAGSDSEARELAQQIRVTNDNGALSASGPSSRRWASWSVSFEIFTPKRMNLDLQTINGPLGVEDVSGTIRLRAENGPLSLSGLGGDVRAHAQNGPLQVELSGSRWDGAGLDAETQNGPLTVDVPDGYNAAFETGTINGPMELGFPMMVQGRIGGGSHRHITTTLGTGGPPVRVVTTNGPAVIRKS